MSKTSKIITQHKKVQLLKSDERNNRWSLAAFMRDLGALLADWSSPLPERHYSLTLLAPESWQRSSERDDSQSASGVLALTVSRLLDSARKFQVF